jgi:hypothetical protein
VIVGDGAQRAADPGALKKHRQHQDEEPGDDRRPQIELVDQDAAGPKPVMKKVMPIVAMKRMSPSWLTSGRNTRRSIAKARASMIRAVATRASAVGITSISRTSANAANRHIAPCAKLNTPDALKISTNPSATNE